MALSPPRTAAVAFFDMPGSTKIMKQNPREAIPPMLRHNAICRMMIESNNGRVVKELGDGLMARFENTGDAVTCAFQVIRCLRAHAGRIRTKVSIAYGAVWDIENQQGDRDVYGTPVHVSQRMSEYAVKDTILIEEKDKGTIVEWLGARILQFDACRPKSEAIRAQGRTGFSSAKGCVSWAAIAAPYKGPWHTANHPLSLDGKRALLPLLAFSICAGRPSCTLP